MFVVFSSAFFFFFVAAERMHVSMSFMIFRIMEIKLKFTSKIIIILI